MTEISRLPTHYYADPLSRVWIACAEALGFRIIRTDDAYASTDGHGNILLAVDALFDPDDSLAQMIFHELCHALVEGEGGEGQVDWGLGYAVGQNPWREHACLRLQAYLSGRVGLRGFFAPTTDFRVSFWDTLPANPFYAPPESGGRRERSCVAARLAAWRAAQVRWAPLGQALSASAAIAAVTPRLTAIAHDTTALPSLWSTVAEPPATHCAGHAPVAAHFAGFGCADCAWCLVKNQRLRCRHAPAARLPVEAPACWRFEPSAELDCLTCGACCREAYHAVEISNREPVNKQHPELVVIQDSRRKLRRSGERCAALSGGSLPTEPFACDIYPLRPRTCREFTRGSENCLDARRRVGLSL